MPVPPSPMKLRCPSCGWEKAISPASDVVTPQEMPETCPECFCSDLETVGLSAWEKTKAHVQGYVNLLGRHTPRK